MKRRRGLPWSVAWSVAALLSASAQAGTRATGSPAAGAQETRPSAALQAWIDAIFDGYDSEESPGCAVGVVKEGDLVLARAYGMADLERDEPLSPTSVFHLASESKQFTAAAVLVAASQGSLSLDDDVREHIPELPDYGATITLRHLLHHTSGVRDYATLWRQAGESERDRHTAEETLALLARQRSLNSPPGHDYIYSNSGYFLLGLALERATGVPLAEFAGEHLFAPLGMSRTRFLDDRRESVADRAVGHLRRPEGGFAPFVGANEVVGARGVVSTIEDLARWERAFHDRTLGDDLVERLLTPGRLEGGDVLPYAAGLVLEDFDGLSTVSHGGEGDGSGAFLLRFPALRLSVICLCNLVDSGVAGLAWQTAIAHLFGPYREETMRHQTPSAPPAFVQLSDETLERWAGSYRDPRTRAVWTVTTLDGDLVVSTGGGTFRLHPVSEYEFRDPGRGQTIRAEFDDDLMRLQVEGRPPSTFPRVEPVAPAELSLDDYVGEYHSEELRASWALEARDGALYFAGPGAPAEPFEPTVRDEFSLGADLRISFARDSTGRVVSMSAHTERVWELRFERR